MKTHLSLALFLCASFVQADTPRKNVLFIAVDDLGNVLGPDKPAVLKTPHLDRLLDRGVCFRRAYCQIPLCNPSRASVMTGKRPDATTVWDLDRHFRTQLPHVVTLSQHFRIAESFVVRVGKIYHYNVPASIGTDGLDDPPSWDRVFNPKGRDVAEEVLIKNPTPHKKISAAMSWLESDGDDDEQTDGLSTTRTIELLKKHRSEPFFIACGFFRPHTPYVAPRPHFARHPLAAVELPSVPKGDRDDIPQAAIPHNIPEPNYGLEPLVLRKSLQAYYASVSLVDAQVGRLLDAVDELGLAVSTVIVFWSDHGYHLGEHHLWQKRTLFDESARAPLVVVAPGVQGGVVCEEIVEFVDILPTVLDLCGLPIPEDADGESLVPLLNDPRLKTNGTAFTQVLRPGDGKLIMGRAVTTDRYRYIEWNAGAEGRELYDRDADPRELRNLAKEESQGETVRRLHELLEKSVSGMPPTTPVNPARL